MFRLLSLWRNLTRRGRVDADLDDELRAALIELGGIESVRQQVRDVRRGALLDTIGQDLRYGWRLLVRNPLFALTAALSLAVGIGATTSIFTVANGLLLRAAEGVVEPGRLVDLVLRVPGRGPGLELMSYPDLVEVRRRARTLDETYGYQLQLSPVSFGFADGVTPGFANLVTANYFQALGVTAAAGRLLEASDGEAAGSNPVAVLSHHFWMRRFAGDPDVVGTIVRLNGVPMTIIGVAAAAFKGLSVVATDAWLPVSAVGVISPEGHGVELTSPRIPWLMGGGRLRPGSTRAQASAEVAAIGAALARERPLPTAIDPPASQGVVDVKRSDVVWSAETATPIPYGVRTLAATFLTVLMAVVSVVLVIACANLAGVLLARATTRRREIAVRTAVGAARGRLVRQLLIETGLLFFIGGVAGIGLARLLTTLLVSLLPVFPLPVSLSVPLDASVLLFTLTLTLIAAVLSGLAPALHASRTDVVTALKDDAQGPFDRLRLRNAFVAVQVAFSILLVVVAGLIVRAFDHTLSRAQGFDPRGVDIASVDLVMAGYTAVSGPEAASRVLARIRQTAGFESASLADRAPGGGARVLGAISVPGVQAPDGRDAFMPNWTVIGPGYFETLRVPVLAGREFTAADAPNAERVAIVSQATARRLWPGRDPLGQYVQVRVNLIPPPPPAQMRIVGVVGDLTADSSAMALYVPLEQRYISQLTFLARRSERDPGSAATLRTAIESAEPGLPVLTADALERAANPVQVQLRIAAVVAGSVGVVGLVLAAIGIYGVTAYAVTQRTREIGIRLSLGARQGEVIALVLRQGMTVILIGSVIGLGLGVAAGRALSRQQYGIPGTDVPTLAAAALLFTVVGLAACYVPVRRAARIRATEALRYE